jgi:vitamin K-dependent gamma-carboxylase
MSLFFIGGFLLGLAVAFGWRFRITAPLFAPAFTYLFLLEKAHYLNHAYLFTWLAWLLALTPAWRDFSLDVRRNPADWSPKVPAWSVWLFPVLMGLVYFFGGIAKMNYDWLVEAMPMKMWLRARAGMPVFGLLWKQEFTAYFMSWSGMMLDFSVPFLLLHKRLRWLALGMLFMFHATNHLLFNIGIFPYLSMVLTSMFFAPDWPKRLIKWMAGPEKLKNQQTNRLIIRARSQVQKWVQRWQSTVARSSGNNTGYWQYRPLLMKPILFGLFLLFCLQSVLPLRHWAFNSEVAWSEEGHRYSWRMMLRSKQGSGNYRIVDKATGEEEVIHPADSLSSRQYRKLATHPDMILQYAHHLRDLRAGAGTEVEVYASFRVRLNGRKPQRFIDPKADLATVKWQGFSSKDWVLEEIRLPGL